MLRRQKLNEQLLAVATMTKMGRLADCILVERGCNLAFPQLVSHSLVSLCSRAVIAFCNCLWAIHCHRHLELHHVHLCCVDHLCPYLLNNKSKEVHEKQNVTKNLLTCPPHPGSNLRCSVLVVAAPDLHVRRQLYSSCLGLPQKMHSHPDFET